MNDKRLIIIIGTIAIVISLIIVWNLTDRRVEKAEERVCQVVLNDIYKQAQSDIVSQIVDTVDSNGEIIINFSDRRIILVPKVAK